MPEDTINFLKRLAEQNPERGIFSAVINDKNGVTVRLKSGLVINDILPESYDIVNIKNSRPRIQMLKIIIDTSLLHNLYYQAGFAHEIGHVIYPNEQQESDEIYSLEFEVLTQKFFTKPLDYRLSIISKQLKLKMNNEIKAWEAGKPIADLIGVDRNKYEELMILGLQGHYSAQVDYISHLIKDNCPDITQNTQISIFNSLTNTDDQMRFSEFTEYNRKMVEMNNRAVNQFDQRIGILRT